MEAMETLQVTMQGPCRVVGYWGSGGEREPVLRDWGP